MIDMGWVRDALKAKIASINWSMAAADVSRFLRPAEAKSLSLWSERFFLAKLEQVVTPRPA